MLQLPPCSWLASDGAFGQPDPFCRNATFNLREKHRMHSPIQGAKVVAVKSWCKRGQRRSRCPTYEVSGSNALLRFGPFLTSVTRRQPTDAMTCCGSPCTNHEIELVVSERHSRRRTCFHARDTTEEGHVTTPEWTQLQGITAYLTHRNLLPWSLPC